MEATKDYKATLTLPNTQFPMKADLPRREPQILKFWMDIDAYGQMVEAARARGGRPFYLHDGPPYANGHIHHGHILNKVLKDIVVKFMNMSGRPCEFIPGWDCHGLPIEHAVEKEVGRDVARSDPKALRKTCRAFAQKWVEIQREEFRRLGVLGDWENPYLTMSYDYEALTLREFGRFVDSGAVYVGHKPVLWCHVCETALAEAEVEYRETISPSVTVTFPFKRGFEERLPNLKGREGAVVIWTTTPWTLPANLAIALHPEAEYVAELVGDKVLLLAEERLEPFHTLTGLKKGEILARVKGRDLEGAVCSHPFLERESLIILGEHVTMDTGTGCVHTAPGHGEEDYEVGQRYGLKPYAPVDEKGRFTHEVPLFAGREVFDCDKDIVDLLRQKGALIHAESFVHSYPHCWRSKNPVIFRATPQWFISVDKTHLRKKALEALEEVRFIPSWGKARITGMLQSRPDWCISRQRAWGVPIVAVRCLDCGEWTTSKDLIDRVADLFEREGADAWFSRDLLDLLPPGFACSRCKGRNLEKVCDILDVWFDSGVSYAAVMERRYGPQIVTDLYLEGSDQHRGWFQSSLLASVGTRGRAPYRQVLTHGFVVDGTGKKLAKSEGNYIDPSDIIKKSGAELLRLWTAAEDYRDDIRISDEILDRLVEAYRKIRNTIRFMLGVVSDFNPSTDLLPTDRLLDLDRYALLRFAQVLRQILQAYENYDFHDVVRLLRDYAISDLSAFYLDIAKDRLYCDLPKGLPRRSAQAAIYLILRSFITSLAPILSFTAEEAYQHLPKAKGDPITVFALPMPDPQIFGQNDEALMTAMEDVLEVRALVLRELEKARVAKLIGHPLEASVHLQVPQGSRLLSSLRRFENRLPEIFVVSQVEVTPLSDAQLSVKVEHAKGQKCARCWTWSEKVGTLGPKFQDVCERCAFVLEALERPTEPTQ